MIAGGCSIPCSYDNPSLLGSLISKITDAWPGADQYIVPYNSDPQQAQQATPVMVKAANDYFLTCPNTPIVFIGYSLGGIIVMNTLCNGNLNRTFTSNVIAAIVSAIAYSR
jgi:hypothetical protein